MNLQVDLLLDTERRSGHQVRLGFLIRVACIVGPLLVLVVAFSLFMRVRGMSGKYRQLQAYVQQNEDAYSKAMALEEEVQNSKTLLDDLRQARSSALPWMENLKALQGIMHPKMQLVRLRIAEDLRIANDLPSRISLLTLQGQAVGNLAQPIVDRFVEKLKASGVLKVPVEDVSVKSFKETTPLDVETERIFEFQVECRFAPRPIENRKVAPKREKRSKRGRESS